MLAIELSALFPFALCVIGAFAVGFLLRGNQIRNSRRRVIELEKEMLNNHAEILELQKERAFLLRQMKESKIPVIPMNSLREEDKRQVK